MTAINTPPEATHEATVAALLELGNVSTSGDENDNASQGSAKISLGLPIVDTDEDTESKKSEEPSLVDEPLVDTQPKKKSISQKERWNNMFTSLLKYKEEHGNTLVPFNYDITATKLGRWVNKQRSQYNNLRRGRPSQMTMERVERLEEVGFEWSVNPLPAMEQWEAKWELLRDFKLRYGHTRVPDNFILEGVKLGQWVTYQRSQRSRKFRGLPCEITDERIEKLDSLGFDWGAMMEGHNDPMMTPPSQGLAMGSHQNMRMPQQMSQMPPMQMQSQAPSWEGFYDLLCRYKTVHGNTRVPVTYNLAGVSLGEWVFAQRQELARMKKGLPYALKGFQIDRLNEIGFDWNVFDEAEEPHQSKRMKMSHPISPGHDSERPMMMGMNSQSGYSSPMTPNSYSNRGQNNSMEPASWPRRSLLERARMMEAVALQSEPESLPEWNTPSTVSPVSSRDMALDRIQMMREKQMRAAAMYQNEAMMDHQPQQPSFRSSSGYYR